MPLQNRVDPFGNLIVTPARGGMMGNRGGTLHNAERQIVRAYKSRRWIACVLEFRGRHRTVMSPNRYTELFFLDEAVAFAAGHRPCAECRRERYNAFKDAWWGRSKQSSPPFADQMDCELHAARIDRQRKKVTYESALSLLPDGAFVQIDGSAHLIWRAALLLWTPEGYAPPGGHGTRDALRIDAIVSVLTPEPIVECIQQGYRPQVHYSANQHGLTQREIIVQNRIGS
jgi:hypothetical protein